MVDIIKRILIALSIAILLLSIVFYLLIIVFLPKLFNSQDFISKIQDEINKKTSLKFEIINHNYKLYKSLYSTIKADEITLKNKDNEVILSINNLNATYKPFKDKANYVEADNIFFDKTKLEKSDKKTNFDFNYKQLPNLKIRNVDLILNNQNPFKIKVSNLKGNLKEDKYIVLFDSTIDSNFIDCPLKTQENTRISIQNNKINFEDFRINFNEKPLEINGFYDFKNDFDLKISANNLSVALIEKMFLYFMKQKEPNNKNFIENFYDFKGLADINLNAKKNSLIGTINLKDFGAKYVKFSIPLYFKNARFNFNQDKIALKEFGTIGGKKAYTDFSADKLFSKDRVIKGNLKASADNTFAKKYIENLEIEGDIDLSLDYTVFNKEITVNYLAELDKGESAIYNNSHFENKDKVRRLFAKTVKKGNTMFLENFDYSTLEGGKIKNIFIGKGQFDRYNNKYHLNYISSKTVEPTPINIFSFFNKLLSGGYFEGDVKYSAKNQQITGNFNVFDTRYKNFTVKNAKINADKNFIIINAFGLFENQPYSAFLNVDNTLYDKIIINDLNLYLKQYLIKRKPKTNRNNGKINREKIVNRVKDADITVKKGKIELDKLLFENIVLENLELDGLIQDNIAYFNMPDINFANGKLSAEGIYDLETKSSNIDFKAKDIDSNIASDMIFNLKNQFEGLANASLYFRSYNNLSQIDAKTYFSISDGALTKLGSKEFLIKKSKDSSRTFKFKLTDILNINEKQIKSIRSNLNGNFDLQNYQIKNAEIFTKQKYISLYLNGNYNIKSQMANIDIFGKYNKNAQKGIKVLFVPLSWVTKAIFNKNENKEKYLEKLDKIPSISGKESDKEIFIVKLKGNPNNNSSLKVKMRALK